MLCIKRSLLTSGTSAKNLFEARLLVCHSFHLTRQESSYSLNPITANSQKSQSPHKAIRPHFTQVTSQTQARGPDCYSSTQRWLKKLSFLQMLQMGERDLRSQPVIRRVMGHMLLINICSSSDQDG